MKQTFATFLGFLGASALPAAYLAVVHPLSGDRDPFSILGTFFVSYFFAAAATIVLGAPMFLVLRRAKLVTWWTAMGSGVLVGVLAILAVRFSGDIELSTLLRFGTLGGAAGLLFWVCWRSGAK